VEITSQSVVEGYTVVDTPSLLEPHTVISDSLPPTIECSPYITLTVIIAYNSVSPTTNSARC